MSITTSLEVAEPGFEPTQSGSRAHTFNTVNEIKSGQNFWPISARCEVAKTGIITETCGEEAA